MNTNSADTRMRDILARLDEASRAAAQAEAAQADVLADIAEAGIRQAEESGATSWREAEEPLRALAERVGAAVNMDAREVRRLMNDALLARRAAEKTRHSAFFRQPVGASTGH
ncbi:hypothetical protein [Microbacterium lacus]|uniref:hypothetical protein n=1 Tax=Microbacterium lacus TaxID=415217 RepID=UPI0012FE3A8A|nr:hypothetical protein [Microbacterium lacus]